MRRGLIKSIRRRSGYQEQRMGDDVEGVWQLFALAVVSEFVKVFKGGLGPSPKQAAVRAGTKPGKTTAHLPSRPGKIIPHTMTRIKNL
jgi:hypothetical protein